MGDVEYQILTGDPGGVIAGGQNYRDGLAKMIEDSLEALYCLAVEAVESMVSDAMVSAAEAAKELASTLLAVIDVHTRVGDALIEYGGKLDQAKQVADDAARQLATLAGQEAAKTSAVSNTWSNYIYWCNIVKDTTPTDPNYNWRSSQQTNAYNAYQNAQKSLGEHNAEVTRQQNRWWHGDGDGGECLKIEQAQVAVWRIQAVFTAGNAPGNIFDPSKLLTTPDQAADMAKAMLNGQISDTQRQELQTTLADHLGDPGWLSNWALTVGGANMAQLLSLLGLAVGDTPNDPWRTLAETVRSAVSVGSRCWENTLSPTIFVDQITTFVNQWMSSPAAANDPSLTGFLFADMDKAPMGAALTLVFATSIADREAVNVTRLQQRDTPAGLYLAEGDYTVEDALSKVLATLGRYPSQASVFWDPSNTANTARNEWLMRDRVYGDGFTGLTASLLATQDPHVGTEEARQLIVSEMTIWLGHNPSLANGLSDQATNSIVKVFSPYLLYLNAVQRDPHGTSSPGVNPPQPVTNLLTGISFESFPLLDDVGLAELIGQTYASNKGHAQMYWMAALALETHAAVAQTSQDGPSQWNLQDDYSYAFGYLTGAQTRIRVEDAQARAQSANTLLDLGSWAADTVIGVYAEPTPGTAASTTIDQLASLLKDHIDRITTTGAYHDQATDARTVIDSIVANWGQYSNESTLYPQNARLAAENGFSAAANRTIEEILGSE